MPSREGETPSPDLPRKKEAEPRRRPVLLREVLNFLRPGPGDVILDGTVGTGGHSQALAARIRPGGKLIGLDRDPRAIEAARKRLAGLGSVVKLHQINFRDFPEVLQEEGVTYLDGLLLDLGVSALHVSDPARGFSFTDDGPLDMRMEGTGSPTAEEIVNRSSQGELQKWIGDLGGDRFATRIARRIVREREIRPIKSTLHLARVVSGAYPRGHQRIHPATRTFQALRILVNRELESLRSALPKIPGHLHTGARAVVISFHSGEDRIVKEFLRSAEREDEMRALTRKPLRPTPEEVEANRWARSAILRAGERIR